MILCKEQFMEIYSVKMLYKFSVENVNRILYEESVCLFHAENFDDAFEKAEKFAEKQYDEYLNIYGNTVIYQLSDLVEAFIIDDEMEFEDGTEVFSTIFEMKNTRDNPLDCRYSRCPAEDMYIIRHA